MEIIWDYKIVIETIIQLIQPLKYGNNKKQNNWERNTI